MNLAHGMCLVNSGMVLCEIGIVGSPLSHYALLLWPFNGFFPGKPG